MNLKHDINNIPQLLPPRSFVNQFNDPKDYIPAPGLWPAVQTAIHLGLPLLVTGEPGTGKTELAWHIAWYYGLGKPEVFNAQTTSSVTDLFYRYNALAHFQYVQTQKGSILTPNDIFDKFIELQALGRAIANDKTQVVLIDEIDKAPRDLPNNILGALENLSFKIPETGDTKKFSYEAKSQNHPIIIMTSNSEKDLPDPFLRRVVYFNIEFPNERLLADMLSKKLDGLKGRNLDAIIKHFNDIRNGRPGMELNKKPATAELLHWASLLVKLNFDINALGNSEILTTESKKILAASYSVLAKSNKDLKKLRDALGVFE